MAYKLFNMSLMMSPCVLRDLLDPKSYHLTQTLEAVPYSYGKAHEIKFFQI